MSTALIFYGQPRFAKECGPLIKERFIEPNNADVFMHFWLPQEGYEYKYSSQEYDPNWKNLHIDSDIESWLVDFYKPKAYLAEEPKDFYLPVEFGNSIEKYFSGVKHLSEKELERWKRIHIRNSLSRWYSIQQAFEIMKSQSMIDQKEYSRIILARFDCYPSWLIDCSKWENHTVYYENLNQPDNMISDWTVIGDHYQIEKLANIYNHWQELVMISMYRTKCWCNESLQREALYADRICPINMGLVLKRM